MAPLIPSYGTLKQNLLIFFSIVRRKLEDEKKNRYWMFLKIKYKQKYGILQSFFNGGQFIQCENNEYIVSKFYIILS